ncbi:MAG: BadF/BadG/BcrA/BcrD ATPase family protein [Terriglobia bacterium]
MGFFLGIDGGGTKTECVLAEESGAVVARATGAGTNLRRVEASGLRATLSDCLEELRRTAGLRTMAVEAVGAGFAGVSDARGRALAEQVLSELLRPKFLYVVGDMEVALEAAVGAGSGVVLIAGTGSVAYGRNDSGQQARAGGRGPQGSDEGSGFDIGRAAVEAARRAAAGTGAETILSDVVPAALGIETTQELEGWASPERAAELAQLVPLVARAARQGDAVAGGILRQAARALATLAVEVVQRLNLTEKEVLIAASGGVFLESPEVVAQARQEILAAAPRARLELLAVSPAEGAVRLAQRRWLQEGATPTA